MLSVIAMAITVPLVADRRHRSGPAAFETDPWSCPAVRGPVVASEEQETLLG